MATSRPTPAVESALAPGRMLKAVVIAKDLTELNARKETPTYFLTSAANAFGQLARVTETHRA